MPNRQLHFKSALKCKFFLQKLQNWVFSQDFKITSKGREKKINIPKSTQNYSENSKKGFSYRKNASKCSKIGHKVSTHPDTYQKGTFLLNFN